MSRMNLLKWILYFILVLIAIGIYECNRNYGDLFDSTSITELQANWHKHEGAILRAKHYYDSIVPPRFEVYVEFNRKGTVDFYVAASDQNAKNGRTLWFQDWDIDFESYTPPAPTAWDSTEYAPRTKNLGVVLETIGWTTDTFKEVGRRLSDANCISIQSGEPVQMGFKRSGLGKYFYDLYATPISPDRMNSFNDSCRYVFQNDTLVFEYGGGAIGPQCFPDFQGSRKRN